eukprot:SAG11_NODE_567_length_8488_cov_4.292764_2_plen_70_part_00
MQRSAARQPTSKDWPRVHRRVRRASLEKWLAMHDYLGRSALDNNARCIGVVLQHFWRIDTIPEDESAMM